MQNSQRLCTELHFIWELSKKFTLIIISPIIVHCFCNVICFLKLHRKRDTLTTFSLSFLWKIHCTFEFGCWVYRFFFSSTNFSFIWLLIDMFLVGWSSAILVFVSLSLSFGCSSYSQDKWMLFENIWFHLLFYLFV